MTSVKIIGLFFTILFSFALAVWGFIGFLPSWAGGLSWLFLLFFVLKELLDIYEESKRVRIVFNAADVLEELQRMKKVKDE